MTKADYLNQTVFCTLKPCYYGIGVFAIRDIPPGIQLTDHTLEEPDDTWYSMNESEFEKVLPEIRALILDRIVFDEGGKLVFVSPNRDALIRSFMNHDFYPNSDGVISLRWIKKGEEITENYQTLAVKPHPLSVEHMRFAFPNN